MDIKPICFEGYDTYYADLQDQHGQFFAIMVTDEMPKDVISGIDRFNGMWIQEWDTAEKDGNRFLKAYYRRT